MTRYESPQLIQTKILNNRKRHIGTLNATPQYTAQTLIEIHRYGPPKSNYTAKDVCKLLRLYPDLKAYTLFDIAPPQLAAVLDGTGALKGDSDVGFTFALKRSKSPNYGKPWADEEVRFVLETLETNANKKALADLFGRGEGSINQIYRWTEIPKKKCLMDRPNDKFVMQIKRIKREIVAGNP